MRAYESIFIIDPKLSEEKVDELVGKMQAVVTSNGGELEKVDKWGKKKLAYEVQGNLEGFYVFFKYKGPAQAVSELERHFRVSDSIIKYLTVKSVEEEKPKVPEPASKEV